MVSESLAEYLRTRQRLVDARLEAYLRPEPGLPASLLEAMRYSLLAPGKRLRPILVLMACAAAGGKEETALPAAAAVEMIHTYSLIHDDLPAMDDDDLRRGRPTCHKKFGDALAILAGDALLTRAFEVLATEYPPRTAAAACRQLARGAGGAGMVGGQVEDIRISDFRLAIDDLQPRPVANRKAEIFNLQSLENIHALKTGALFRACLHLGVLAAQGEVKGGPDPAIVDSLERFGRCFGLVFQITDDLVDVEGNATDAGKRVHKDAVRGKLTYPGLLGVAESRRRAEAVAEEGVAALEPLKTAGKRLAELLCFVLTRDR